jgi:hypothetical protein
MFPDLDLQVRPAIVCTPLAANNLHVAPASGLFIPIGGLFNPRGI